MRGFAVAASLCALLARAHPDSLRSQVEATTKAVDRFVLARDAKSLKAYLKGRVTPDYRFADGRTTMTLDQACAREASDFQRISKMLTVVGHVIDVRREGKTASVKMAGHVVYAAMGRDRKLHTVALSGVSDETYVLLSRTWKLSKTTRRNMTMTVDGKPLPTRPKSPSRSPRT